MEGQIVSDGILQKKERKKEITYPFKACLRRFRLHQLVSVGKQAGGGMSNNT